MEKANTTTKDHHATSTTANVKVKLMCSYGGKIQPRPTTNQLAYVGGDTKLLTVDRNVRFSDIVVKLSALCNVLASECRVKYQLPGDGLDALVSVVDDDDVEHMMFEYDRLLKDPTRAARIRLFLFGNIGKQAGLSSGSSTPLNPDFLFGFDKEYVPSSVSALGVEKENQITQTPTVTAAAASPSPPPALDLLQIPGMIVPGFSGCNHGTSDHSVGVHGPREHHVTGGAYVYRIPVMAGEGQGGYYFVPAMPSVPKQKMMIPSMGMRDQPSHEIKVNQRNI